MKNETSRPINRWYLCCVTRGHIHVYRIKISFVWRNFIKMPSNKTHKKFGFFAAIVVTLLISLLTIKYYPKDWRLILIFIIIPVYAQLPDLDSAMSRIRKHAYLTIFTLLVSSGLFLSLINIYITIVIYMIIGLFGLLMMKVKHRGPFHSYWFVLFMSLPMVFLHWYLFVIAFVAASSHIFLDKIYSRTKQRVKKWFGFGGQKHTWNIKVGW